MVDESEDATFARLLVSKKEARMREKAEREEREKKARVEREERERKAAARMARLEEVRARDRLVNEARREKAARMEMLERRASAVVAALEAYPLLDEGLALLIIEDLIEDEEY